MAKRDLDRVQRASTRQEMDEMMRALRDASKLRRAEQQQIALGIAKEKSVKYQIGTDQAKSSSETLFSFSGQKEEVVQGSPSVTPACVFVDDGGGGEVLPSDMFMWRVDEIRTWVMDHMGRLPKRTSGDATERTLGNRWNMFNMRCRRDVGVSRCKFLPSEKLYFERIWEVVCGYESSQSASNARFVQQVDEIRRWVINHMGRLPNKRRPDAMERTLANRYEKFKMRCVRDLRTRRRGIYAFKLLPSQKAYFDSLKEVVQWHSRASSGDAFLLMTAR